MRPNRPWNLLTSAYHAYSGLLWVAPRTPSLKLGIGLVVVVVGLGFALRFSLVEIALLVLAGTLLLAVETLNTALELLCDFVHPQPDDVIGKVKDVAAGATALCEIGGGAVLLLILVPHVLQWLGR
jgi:diacylglycerol kinase (ATP)